MEKTESNSLNMDIQSEVPQPELDQNLNSPQLQTMKSKSLVLMLLGIIGFILIGIGGYYLGLMNSNVENKVSDSSQIIHKDNIVTDEMVACTMEAKECPDGSFVGRVGPDCEFEQCPIFEETLEKEEVETWEREQYISNGQLVWDILQPVNTEVNKAGLHEGYLGLNSVDGEGNKLMAEFSFPIFTETGIPETLDDWVEIFMEKNLGDTFIDREVMPMSHIQGVSIKLIKTTSISPGGIKNSQIPFYFVLIWKHENKNGGSVNPSIISIKPNGDHKVTDKVINDFTLKIVQGIRF